MNRKMNMPAVVAGALLAISAFLPYLSMGEWGTYSRISANSTAGIFTVILGLGAAALAYLRKDLGVIIVGAIATIISLYGMKEFSDYAYLGVISKGIGFWLMLLSSIAILVCGILRKMDKI